MNGGNDDKQSKSIRGGGAACGALQETERLPELHFPDFRTGTVEVPN